VSCPGTSQAKVRVKQAADLLNRVVTPILVF
jgi:hypothetical protein